MFSLIVSSIGWESGRGTADASRVLEYTDAALRARFKPGNKLDLAALRDLPAIFAAETSWDGSQPPARVGTITRATQSGNEVRLEFVFDQSIPPLSNATLVSLADDLEIDVKSSIDEFSRNHWSVKDVDLFRVLLRSGAAKPPEPKVFSIDQAMQDPDLVAVMMPFDAAFRPVHQALTKAAEAVGMKLKRADDIWVDDKIIQDVVTLMCQAKVVICDLSGRNANVFYEMGIAHMLPRDVIMITQQASDVPFDVAHIRHIRYLNNGEGLDKLATEVQARLTTLKAL